jgi:hypothetical protein
MAPVAEPEAPQIAIMIKIRGNCHFLKGMGEIFKVAVRQAHASQFKVGRASVPAILRLGPLWAAF